MREDGGEERKTKDGIERKRKVEESVWPAVLMCILLMPPLHLDNTFTHFPLRPFLPHLSLRSLTLPAPTPSLDIGRRRKSVWLADLDDTFTHPPSVPSSSLLRFSFALALLT